MPKYRYPCPGPWHDAVTNAYDDNKHESKWVQGMCLHLKFGISLAEARRIANWTKHGFEKELVA